MKIFNTYRQPASTVSAVLLNNMPEMQARPDRIIEIAMPPVEKAETDAPDIYQLITVAQSGDEGAWTVNFEGNREQVFPIVRHIFCEQMAKQVFEGSMSLADARKAKSAFRDLEDHIRPVPLFVTTDKIFAHDLGFGLDDFKKNVGPVFSYYEQDWQEGLERAAESATPEEIDDPAYNEIMQHFLSASSSIIYPAFFYAEHNVTDLETEHGTRQVDCWDIKGAEPHQIRYYTSVLYEEAIGTALSILTKGFIDDRIDADPALGRLREFNSLHYGKVRKQGKAYMNAGTKAQLTGGILFNRDLS